MRLHAPQGQYVSGWSAYNSIACEEMERLVKTAVNNRQVGLLRGISADFFH